MWLVRYLGSDFIIRLRNYHCDWEVDRSRRTRWKDTLVNAMRKWRPGLSRDLIEFCQRSDRSKSCRIEGIVAVKHWIIETQGWCLLSCIGLIWYFQGLTRIVCSLSLVYLFILKSRLKWKWSFLQATCVVLLLNDPKMTCIEKSFCRLIDLMIVAISQSTI